MGSKTFLTINRSESYAAHLSVIKNSDTKWKSSLTAAGQEDFGSATALAIISVEEMIKALVISLDGKGFMFRGVPGFDTLFKNHQIRYFLAYTMFVVWVFGEDIKALFAKFSNKPEAFIEFSMKLFSNDPEINRQIELYSINKFEQMKIEYEWFSKLDVFRQDAFYCDYDDYLKSPIHITPNVYQKLSERMQAVRTTVKDLIVSVWSEEEVYKNHIEMMKKFMIEKGIYKHIENGLKDVRLARTNPFEVVAKKFRELP